MSANLKAGGAPELLSALLEGESLFNDASGLVCGIRGPQDKVVVVHLWSIHFAP